LISLVLLNALIVVDDALIMEARLVEVDDLAVFPQQ
jgi:hypothetical protein